MRPVPRLYVTSLLQVSYRSQSPYTPFVARSKRDHSSTQKHVFEGYLADKLDAPLWTLQSQTSTQATAPPLDELPMTAKDETLAKARVIFGSRLAGPGERREQIAKLSTNVAGVMVPPKPEEPENCCMSGCVNCVWDMYRDELEEWAEQSGKARAKLNEQTSAGSMEDDGAGRETLWDPLGDGGPDLFADIPVGIREFMKTEKKLKERKKQARAG